MFSRAPAHREVSDLHKVDTVELLRLCVADREAQPTWTELLRRILPRLSIIIRRAIVQSGLSAAVSASRTLQCGLQESDLTQQVVMRLVTGDCELLRRFSGQTEDDLFAYLAVVSRSVVRDCLRRMGARKRGPVCAAEPRLDRAGYTRPHPGPSGSDQKVEHLVLARELAEIGARVLEDSAPHLALRDQLIFQLYFFHGLTMEEIAGCRGVNLSVAGVDKVLTRLTERIKAAATASRPEVASR
jgi:RNA polymerase sigma factor (sigma-70 family)